MVATGNGGFGSDSGDGALEMATTSKDSCRRANYPLLTKGDSDETYRRGAMLCDRNGGVLNRHQNAIGGQLWCQQPR